MGTCKGRSLLWFTRYICIQLLCLLNNITCCKLHACNHLAAPLKYVHTYVRTYVRKYVRVETMCYNEGLSIKFVMYVHVACTYLYTYVVNPLVEVTAVTRGCGYLSARWDTIGIISELCRSIRYNVTLSSATMDGSMPILTTANFYSFTGLPNDTLFYVTVFGHTVFGLRSNIEVTSVRTISTFVCTYVSIRIYLVFKTP